MPRFSSLLSCAVVAVLFSSCAAIERHAQEKRNAEERAAALIPHTAWRAGSGWKSKTYRNEDLLALATADNSTVEISLAEQRGLLLVNSCVAMDFPVASGKSSHPTPTGEFRILGKEKDYSSNLYGKIVDVTGTVVVENADTRTDVPAEGTSFEGARMPYWMRLTDTGVGMHVGYVPGRPASHGCIRLKRETATRLFKLLKIGTPVVVAEKAPALQTAPAN
ncbi:MAG: L,D-transpeptidase [Terrimicrobiaceae bacterium]